MTWRRRGPGVCRYREKRIDLSVSYCLAASRAEIEDTVLHEIAHAIVGPKHNHDAVWKAKAREIGCQGERCHRVQHSVPRWVGECGCGQQWFRQTLQRRMIRQPGLRQVHGQHHLAAEQPGCNAVQVTQGWYWQRKRVRWGYPTAGHSEMEVTLNAESVAVISIGVVILLSLVGGFVAQVRYTSKLPTREELHAVRDELRQEMQAMREEFRRDMAAMRDELREEFRRDMAAMRDELRQEMAAMRDELREDFRRDIAAARDELRQEMATMRDELRRDIAAVRDELLTAIRDSETRIINALVNHRHIEPDGAPIFVGPV